ncbi:MAG TPA: 3-methyl-2-oxobutanoate hydroxymethyltransferase [Gammaproteobacteria bacterium]
MSNVTLTTLRRMKQEGKPFACLTAYDASFARLIDEAGAEVVLVGDSLGMVVQGQESTLPVTVDEMIYHTRIVRRGTTRALVMSDMPFMSYADPQQALQNAGRLMKEGGAHIVKLEGGALLLDTVRLLASHGIPVCAHLGLLPQSVHKLGGYKVQGRDEAGASAMIEDAQTLVAAGADVLLIECVPQALASAITASVDVPVIGIGAGPECDGQVLVSYDMLAITPGKRPRFSKDFLAEAGSISAALASYVSEVKARHFPGPEHVIA